MKATNFIQSKDIAKHLEKIEYNFSSVECAFLIWQSCKTLREKQEAWQEIIDTMPDCDFFMKQANKQQSPLRLHTYLKELLHNQQKMLDDFFKADGGIYSFSHIYDVEGYSDFNNGLFHNHLSCLEAVKGYFGDRTSDGEIKVRKQYVDSSKDIVLTMNLSSDVIKIDSYVGEEDVLGNCFKKLFFEFSTPFHVGDILRYTNGEQEQVFVLTSLCALDVYSKREFGSADMTAHGYFAGADGGIYYDWVHNFLCCELCRDEAVETPRSLLLLSDYINEKVQLSELVNLYHAILLDEGGFRWRDEKEFPDTLLKRYGLPEIH